MNIIRLKTLPALFFGLTIPFSVYAASPLSDALSYRSDDGNFTIRMGGRIQFDAASYDDDLTPMQDGSEIRRLRLKVGGSIYKDWKYSFAYDEAAEKDFRIKGAYIGYNGFKGWNLKLGNLQQPFSLEELTSSKHITFMERSLVNTFSPSYTLGFTANTWGKDWSATVGVFEDSIADRNQNNDGGNAIAARLTYQPIKNKKMRLHLGAATVYQNIDSTQTISFSSRPESHYTDAKLVSTGTLTGIDSKSLYGLEAALIAGPWSLQGEYVKAKLDSDDNSDSDFDGWYTQASWFVTGEKRRYSTKNGAFTSIKPKSKYGAIELAVRYSDLNLEDGAVTGGEEQNTTLGVNWYINEYVKTMINYVDVNAEPNRNGDNEDADVVQLRLQAWF